MTYMSTKHIKWMIPAAAAVGMGLFVKSQGFNLGMGTLPTKKNKTIRTAPGEVIPQGTTFVQYGRISARPKNRGTVERIDYTTDLYEDGVTYYKHLNVYLPYGYNPNDKGKKYNVIYFQHGNTNDPDIFMNYGNSITWFDNLFASGKVEPAIVVFPTYYMDVTKNVETRKKTGRVPAGDGNWDGLPGNYYREVTEVILPLVESRYNTYTESFDRVGLIASRAHRCFSGYSRGGVCTWYMMHNALEFFKWYSPMSCHCLAGKRLGEDEVTPEDAYEYLKEAIDAHPDMDYFIYAASGNAKDAPLLREQMKYFVEQTGTFSYGPNPMANNLYYTISDFRHADFYAPFYFYNSLQVIFH